MRLYLRDGSAKNFTCCHTEIEVAGQTFHLTQSRYTDTGPTSPSTDPITPGAWQGSHWSANFSRRKRDSHPGSSALEADALITRPTRRSEEGQRRDWGVQMTEVPYTMSWACTVILKKAEGGGQGRDWCWRVRGGGGGGCRGHWTEAWGWGVGMGRWGGGGIVGEKCKSDRALSSVSVFFREEPRWSRDSERRQRLHTD